MCLWDGAWLSRRFKRPVMSSHYFIMSGAPPADRVVTPDPTQGQPRPWDDLRVTLRGQGRDVDPGVWVMAGGGERQIQPGIWVMS